MKLHTLKRLHIIGQGLNVLDLVYTTYFVFITKTWVEINPVPVFLIEHLGWWGVLLGKVVTALLIYHTYNRFKEKGRVTRSHINWKGKKEER